MRARTDRIGRAIETRAGRVSTTDGQERRGLAPAPCVRASTPGNPSCQVRYLLPMDPRPRTSPRWRGIEIELAERVLDNGLTVQVHEDPSAPMVAVHLGYHVGSAREEAGRTGFAHLFEHLLFEGSQNVAKGGHFRHV